MSYASRTRGPIVRRELTEAERETIALTAANNKSKEELARLEAEAEARLAIANEVVREAQREKNTMQAEARAAIRVWRKAAQDSSARRTDKLDRRRVGLDEREQRAEAKEIATQRTWERVLVSADRAGAKYADAQAQVDQALSLMVEVKARQVRVADVKAEAQALNDAAEEARQRLAKEARRVAIEWELVLKAADQNTADTSDVDRRQRLLDEEIERARSSQRAFEDMQREIEDTRVTLRRERKDFKEEQEAQAAARTDIKERLREIHDREDAVSRREREARAAKRAAEREERD